MCIVFFLCFKLDLKKILIMVLLLDGIEQIIPYNPLKSSL